MGAELSIQPFMPSSGVMLFIWTNLLILLLFVTVTYTSAYAEVSVPRSESEPILVDPKLRVDTVFKGIKFPVSMAFLGNNDILVLEKNEGTVRRIVNGVMLENPLLKVNVSSAGEGGMLGIAIAKDDNTLRNLTHVFVYYTEATQKKAEDQSSLVRNRLYRYELVDDKLVNPKLILDLPGGTLHNGGVVLIGFDKNVYLIVGDTLASNPQESELVDGTAGILRVNQEGNAVKNQQNQSILGNTHPSNKYYAYGIRNGFGMDFDPVTGKLWDTENGAEYGDEINLVEPGFNSGWGSAQVFGTQKTGDPEHFVPSPNPIDLANFGGRLAYSPPELAIFPTIGITALTFLNSTNYGKEYENVILVGDFHIGNLYRLQLTKNRGQLQLNDQLSDKVANNMDQLEEIILGRGFGGITDIEIGPDGNIYVLSLHQGGVPCDNCRPYITNYVSYNLTSSEPGTIFRIVPANSR